MRRNAFMLGLIFIPMNFGQRHICFWRNDKGHAILESETIRLLSGRDLVRAVCPWEVERNHNCLLVLQSFFYRFQTPICSSRSLAGDGVSKSIPRIPPE